MRHSRAASLQSRSQSGGVEAVEAGHARSRDRADGRAGVRRSPSAVTQLGEPPTSSGRIGRRRSRGSRASRSRTTSIAFLRLERAGAVDEGAARPGQLDRAREQPALQGGERGDVGLALEPGNVGMAADGAGRRAGRIEQHRVERARLPLRDVGRDGLGRRARGGRDSAAAARAAPAARSTAVTRAPAAASCAVLPPGAAHRSATVRPRTSPSSRAGSAAAASCTHQAPSAIARQLRRPAHARSRAPSRSAARGRRAARPSAPASLLDREVERRLVAVGVRRWRARSRRRRLCVQRAISQSGVSSAAVSTPASCCAPSRAIRRSTALTRPA